MHRLFSQQRFLTKNGAKVHFWFSALRQISKTIRRKVVVMTQAITAASVVRSIVDVRYEDRLIYIVRLGCGNKAEHTRNYSGRNE